MATEAQQQPDVKPRGTQVRSHLGEMQLLQGFDGLQFDHDRILHGQVQPMHSRLFENSTTFFASRCKPSLAQPSR
jgi:hypothetical protein